ncbi:MAG: GMC family oxidoreductase N-terminal domain-containing protein [Pseudomonadota bacterium]
MSSDECEFVIVGAGSSGCAIASRLSEHPDTRVTLLEAGPRDTSFWIHLPIGYGKTMWSDAVNWRFYTEPEPNMAGRRIYWPRGRVLGGSSSINGLIAIRGQQEDYERWHALGNPGWSWRDVLPYFKRLESNDLGPAGGLHGTTGPLAVTSIRRPHPLIEAVIAAAESLGVHRTRDFNGARQEGVGYYQLTTRNGLRVSAAKAYLRPAHGRSNLQVVTSAYATGIVMSRRRAVGVRFLHKGVERTIRATRGVILSAGALQSPQLLMLSGIGPAAHLATHGVSVLVDRPEVGRNLQDHLQVRLIYRCKRPITTNDQLNSWIGRARIGLQWALARSGPLAVGINQGGLFTRVLPQSLTPDIQFHIATLSADMAGGAVHPFSGCTLSVCQLRPESRGHLELASPDPLQAPRMHANYLDAETDRRCAIAAVGFARKLAATRPLADEIAEEVLPGTRARTEEDLLTFARQNGATIFHPSGTCRMGSDDGAVVDPRLRVRGVEALWVADCSIMPTLVSGNTNLPAIMIGEKAADMICADAKPRAITARTQGVEGVPARMEANSMG